MFGTPIWPTPTWSPVRRVESQCGRRYKMAQNPSHPTSVHGSVRSSVLPSDRQAIVLFSQQPTVQSILIYITAHPTHSFIHPSIHPIIRPSVLHKYTNKSHNLINRLIDHSSQSIKQRIHQSFTMRIK